MSDTSDTPDTHHEQPSSPAEITDLLSHLHRLHARATGRESSEIGNFVRFCREFLDQNRPAETWAADRNIGFTLSDNHRLLLCPNTQSESAGAMEPSGAVSITVGRSQPGQEGVDRKDSHRIV